MTYLVADLDDSPSHHFPNHRIRLFSLDLTHRKPKLESSNNHADRIMGSTKRERPFKRNLVRWSGREFGRQWRLWLTTLTDDLDKQVLLTVQYACNEAGVRIPWDDVALKMCEIVGEDKFTGGAIIQHLSKLRSKMESHALKVPPPLRRGLIVNAPSKIYSPSNKRKGGPRTAKTPKSSTAR